MAGTRNSLVCQGGEPTPQGLDRRGERTAPMPIPPPPRGRCLGDGDLRRALLRPRCKAPGQAPAPRQRCQGGTRGVCGVFPPKHLLLSSEWLISLPDLHNLREYYLLFSFSSPQIQQKRSKRETVKGKMRYLRRRRRYFEVFVFAWYPQCFGSKFWPGPAQTL